MAEAPNPNPQTHIQIELPSPNQTPMAENPNPDHNPNPQTHIKIKHASLDSTSLQPQTPMAESPNPDPDPIPETHVENRRPPPNPTFLQTLTPIAESPNLNPQTHVEIKTVQPPLQIMSTELTAEELLKEQKLPFPFFRRLSHRKESTWVISVFVILHLIAFAATMIINDCWRNSHEQCVFKQLGRFSFQPLPENPLLGPSASAWVSRFRVVYLYVGFGFRFSWISMWKIGSLIIVYLVDCALIDLEILEALCKCSVSCINDLLSEVIF